MGKDLFSSQSEIYARYRPTYPPQLFEYIVSFVSERNIAWDCATGNGQAAVQLADHFRKVIATDISIAQIEQAVSKVNIDYQLSAAESTPFAENTFDLITVAQAYHWIKWSEFRKEVKRVGKPGSLIAIWMYHNNYTGDEKIDQAILEFYHNVTGPYWDPERKFIEEKYATVEFDFEQLPVKDFKTTMKWKRADMLGYISSWSAIQKFIKANGYSPIPSLEEKIKVFWNKNEQKNVVFPIYLKLGRV